MEKEIAKQSLVDKKNEFFILTKESIQEKIHEIRGQQVMLDFDLAEIYGYTTKRFNEQIKRNMDRFDGLIFQLTSNEVNSLWSQNATLNKRGDRTGMHYKYMPYAFTESGIYINKY